MELRGVGMKCFGALRGIRRERGMRLGGEVVIS